MPGSCPKSGTEKTAEMRRVAEAETVRDVANRFRPVGIRQSRARAIEATLHDVGVNAPVGLEGAEQLRPWHLHGLSELRYGEARCAKPPLDLFFGPLPQRRFRPDG